MSYNTIASLLYSTLKRGEKKLSNDAIKEIKTFISSQIKKDGFGNRIGKTDVYYTFFGLLLCTIFKIKIDLVSLEKHLEKIDAKELDLVHLASYIRSLALIDFLKKNPLLRLFQRIPRLKNKENLIEIFNSLLHSNSTKLFPNLEKNSAYSQFLFHIIAETLCVSPPQKKPFTHKTTTTNLAAELILSPSNECIQMLLKLQLPSGAFPATTLIHSPDIISTATARFALLMNKNKALLPVKNFVFSHWRTNGGFAAHELDECADVEYTFYALLTIGAS